MYRMCVFCSFPFFQTNNFEINVHNYLWPPLLRTTAIKLINRGRLSVSPDCCVIRGAINKAVLLPCDILQMVWQQLLLLQLHTDQYTRTIHHRFLQFPLFRLTSFSLCDSICSALFALCLSHRCYPPLASYRKHSSN